MTQFINLVVNDKPDILMRITGLCMQRGYEIESLTVGRCEEAGYLRIVLAVPTKTRPINQLIRQLAKPIDVVSVTHVSERPYVTGAFALIRIHASIEQLGAVIGMIHPYGAMVVHADASSQIIQIAGDEAQIDSLCKALEIFGILELTRTGTVAMAKSADAQTKAQNGA